MDYDKYQWSRASSLEHGKELLNEGCEAISFHEIVIGVKGAKEVGELLKKNKTCAALSLHANCINWEAASYLAEALQENETLSWLALPENEVGDEGAAAFAETLQLNTTLSSLNLDDNGITDKGIESFALALEVNDTLLELSLSWNKMCKRGYEAICHSLTLNNTLVGLFLLHDPDHEVDICTKAFIDALRQNTSLSCLGIYCKDLDSQEEIQNLLEKNKKANFRRINEQMRAFELALESDKQGAWMRSKLMVVGQAKAGKTSIVRSLLGEEFNPNWDSTIGASLTQSHGKAQKRKRWVKTGDSLPYTTSLAARIATTSLSRYHGTLPPIKHKSKDKTVKEGPNSQVSTRKDKISNKVSSEQGRNNDSTCSATGKRLKHVSSTSSILDLAPVMKEVTSKRNILNTEEQVKRKRHIASLMANSRRARNTLHFSIWDYGGQEVFYTLHHIFLTQYGVYLLAFSMEDMIINNLSASEYIAFWLKSVTLHAPNAPVIIVGTCLDTVNTQKEFELVNAGLENIVSRMKGVQIIANSEQGLSYFPVNNKDITGVVELRKTIDEVTLSQEHVHLRIPLRWTRCLDCMMENFTNAWLKLSQITQMAKENGINTAMEVNEMLKTFHQLGVIVYLTATESLQNIVAINPEWLLKGISKVIREYSVHGLDVQDITAKGLDDDVACLVKSALASRDILEYFWGERTQFFIDFMKETMLLSEWTYGREKRYLVPSLLKENDLVTAGGDSDLVCKFDFGFLPIGVFERLVCLCVELSSRATSPKQPMLSKSSALIWLEEDEFYMHQEGDSIFVKVHEDKKICVSIIFSLLKKLKREVMGQDFTWEAHITSKSKNSNNNLDEELFRASIAIGKRSQLKLDNFMSEI